MKRLLVISLLATTLIGAAALAVTKDECDFDKSPRNSISYVDLLLFTGAKPRLSEQNQRFLLGKIGETVRLPRFDYNALPEEYVKDFRESAGRKDHSLDQLGDLIDETLTPHLLRVLDNDKLARAMPEVERERFIVMKAKEDGVTAADLEAVMNSAYLFYCFVDSLRFETSGEGKNEKTRAKLYGGIAWYHLTHEADSPRVEFVGVDRVSGSGAADKGDTKFQGRKVKRQDYAYLKACESFVLLLPNKVAERFPTRAPLEQFEYPWASFRLGTREGIKVDTKFHVAECYENEKGERKLRRVGYVMARKLGENRFDRTALTRAKAIIGHKFETGMMAIEHPRVGVDLLVGAAWHPLKIPTVVVADTLVIAEEYTGGVYAVEAAVQVNTAPALRIPQFFLTLQGDLGIADVDGTHLDGDDLPVLKFVRVGAGLLKKHYSSRIALAAEAQGFFNWLSFGKKVAVGGDDIEYEYRLWRWGGAASLGLEIALTIDFNFGVAASYQELQRDRYLEFWVGSEQIESFREKRIEFEQDGLVLKTYVTYSI